MGTSTTTFTLTVTAPATTYIGQLAATMSSATLSDPLVGTSGAVTINDLIGDRGEASGTQSAFQNYASSNKLVLQWPGKAQWDGSYWWYVAGSTGDEPGDQTAVRYNPMTDEFRHWTGTSLGDNDPEGIWWDGVAGYGSPHNFEMTTWNPVTRKIYKGLVAYDTLTPVAQRGLKIAEWSPDSVGEGNTNGTAVWALPGGIPMGEYLPIVCHPGMGSLGTLVIIRRSNAQIYRVDIASRTAASTLVNPTTQTYRAPCCYHTLTGDHADGFVYYGTGGADLNFYKISASGVITQCRDTPIWMHAMGENNQDDRRRHTTLVPIGSYIYAFNLSATDQLGAPNATRDVYRYDPALDVWSATGTDLSGLTPMVDTWCAVGPVSTTGSGEPDVALIVNCRDTSAPYQFDARIWKP